MHAWDQYGVTGGSAAKGRLIVCMEVFGPALVHWYIYPLLSLSYTMCSSLLIIVYRLH